MTPGNIHDIVEAPALIEAARGDNFIADKGYDSNAVVAAVRAKGMKVEFFFNRLKQYRRVATRYEKTARNFLGFALLASSLVWLA